MRYEIIATPEQKEKFKKVAKTKMIARGMKYSDIAREVAYGEKTIYYFFSKGKWSRFLSAYLAEKLNIKEEEWK